MWENSILKALSIVLISSVFLQGCVTSTLITSIPEGAKVYVDGQFLGKTPATQRDSAILGSSKTVVVKLDGYHPTVGTIRKEELNQGALIAGIFLLIPLLWVMGYPSKYVYELEPLPPPPQVQPSPPSS